MKKTLFLLITLLFCGSIFAQTQKERLTHHVYYLASDSLRGRAAGSEDAAKAAAYIANQFEEIGIQPFFNDCWYQPFEQYGRSYKNVVGVIPGNDPVLKDEYIVIGAHYDHLGVRNEEVYNGADDNASGTATIIEMARILKQQQSNLKRSVIIAAFDAEEIGLHGSNYLSSKLDPSKVKLMMSIDMVGWLEKGKSLQLNGAATIKNGKRLLRDEAEKLHINVNPKVRFLPDMLKGEAGRQRMLAVLRKFIDGGGHEIQFNVTDNGVLEQAVAEPEKYADLVVRVSGFSGYFTRLSPAVQKDILRRNIHAS